MRLLLDPINIGLSLVAIFNFALGIVIYSKRKISRVNRVYSWNIFFIISWIVAMFLYRSAEPTRSIFWCTILYVTPTFIASSFLYFTYIFPEPGDKVSRLVKSIVVAANLLIIILVILPKLIIKDVYVPQIGEKIIYFGPWYFLYAVYTMFFFSFGFYRLFKKFLNFRGEKRNQVIYLLIGYALAANLAFITNLILPWIQRTELNWMGQICTILMVSFTVYAIVKHKLMDIKVLSAQIFVFLLIIIYIINSFFVADIGTISFFQLSLRILGLVSILVFSFLLIHSVKKEVQRREEVTNLARSLEQANARLKELDKAKSDFISIASHQLRTPLTAIKGYLSMIKDGDFGPVAIKLRDPIDKVFQSADRLINLVEDLLNISRIESGRMEYNFRKDNLDTMVKSVVDELRPNADKKHLKLEYLPPATAVPKVRMDTDKLRQVVMNFIDNSIKYTDKGFVRVSLAVQVGAVRFTVEDSGMGIDKKDLGQLFQKFTRGRGTSIIHTEGTGLGLYVARKIIEAHGGRAWAESEGAGKGSRFIFELPIGKN